MTGKLADTVMSVRNGEQIARKYQPVVFNPSTPAQVAQRAKMKLLSQLSAVMAPAIAIPRDGTRSARNLFTKENFGATSYADSTADISLSDIKITKSVVALPDFLVYRADNKLLGYLNDAESLGDLGLSRVVYCFFTKQADNSLRFSGSEVSSSAAGGFNFERDNIAGNLEVYAYGVRDNSDAARVAFGNMEVLTAETVAKLITTNSVTAADITVTETKHFALAAADNAKTEKKTSK